VNKLESRYRIYSNQKKVSKFKFVVYFLNELMIWLTLVISSFFPSFTSLRKLKISKFTVKN
jgi:hypothetical protein